jgi:hypothetical protein
MSRPQGAFSTKATPAFGGAESHRFAGSSCSHAWQHRLPKEQLVAQGFFPKRALPSGSFASDSCLSPSEMTYAPTPVDSSSFSDAVDQKNYLVQLCAIESDYAKNVYAAFCDNDKKAPSSSDMIKTALRTALMVNVNPGYQGESSMVMGVPLAK